MGLNVKFTISSALLFGTICSAVDPVAVSHCVFLISYQLPTWMFSDAEPSTLMYLNVKSIKMPNEEQSFTYIYT